MSSHAETTVATVVTVVSPCFQGEFLAMVSTIVRQALW